MTGIIVETLLSHFPAFATDMELFPLVPIKLSLPVLISSLVLFISNTNAQAPAGPNFGNMVIKWGGCLGLSPLRNQWAD